MLALHSYLALGLLASFGSSSSPSHSIFTFTELEEIMRAEAAVHNNSIDSAASYLQSLGAPSTSVAVLDNGLISPKTYSTVGDNIQTVFQAASLSKAVTAMAIMKLVDKGKLSVYSTIEELLPSEVLKILTADTDLTREAMVRNITIKQLMSHTSGLSLYGFAGYSAEAELPSASQVLAGGSPSNSMPVYLESLPGLQYRYSGGGFTVLQVILETLIQKDFPSLMQDLVLKKLGMTRSFYGTVPDEETNVAEAYYTGDVMTEEGRRVYPHHAASSLYTTPTDMLKVINAVQNSLSDPEGGGFLRKETAEEMLTLVDCEMAMSWFIPERKGHVFTHYGTNGPGFRALVIGYADTLKTGNQDIPSSGGMVVMVNSAVGESIIYRIYQAIAYLKRWPEIPSTESYGKVQTPFTLPNTEPGSLWKGWTGCWENDAGKTFALNGDAKGQPHITYSGSGPLRLIPVALPQARAGGGEGFRILILEKTSIMLHFKDEGRAMELLNGATGKTMSLKKTDACPR
jgi:CubicO group peptidase (beta-lactamase class C family)